jgi:hypothetical protein
MAAMASRKLGAKSKVNGWLTEAFVEHWSERLARDKQRPRYQPKPKRPRGRKLKRA